jgi:hypothetical protein
MRNVGQSDVSTVEDAVNGNSETCIDDAYVSRVNRARMMSTA